MNLLACDQRKWEGHVSALGVTASPAPVDIGSSPGELEMLDAMADVGACRQCLGSADVRFDILLCDSCATQEPVFKVKAIHEERVGDVDFFHGIFREEGVGNIDIAIMAIDDGVSLFQLN